MGKRYLCIFRGVYGSEDRFRAAMHQFGLSEAFLDQLISRAPVVIKRDVDLKEARRYFDALQDAGGLVSIVENGITKREKRETGLEQRIAPFEAFVMCPECGLKQSASARCVKCGRKLGGEAG